MAKKHSGVNPFYVLLVIVGIAFTLTACAYGVMAIRAIHPSAAGKYSRDDNPAGKALLVFLDRHGASTLAAELGLLAVCTFGAIGTDQYWTRKKAQTDGDQIATGFVDS